MRLLLAALLCLPLSAVVGCASGTSSNSGNPKSQPQAPTANAGGPYAGKTGASVSFSGTGSSDPQGQALTYAWNFGDSTTGTGAAPTHTYAAAGSYTVSLTVTDTSSLSATATATATITNAAPTAKPGGPYTARPGTAISFNGSASTDPQGQTLAYAWNFGDSTTGTGATPTHTYASQGTYTVSLTVTDTSNLSATATTTATIAPQAPTANPGGPYNGKAGTAVSFNGAGSTDPQGQTLTYAWNFGDTTTGTGATPTHTYSVFGTYTVSLTVTDASGLSGTATTTANIPAQPPVVSSGGPYNGLLGSPINFNASGSSDPQNESLTYAWNFGDNGTSTSATPSHTYATAGTFNVSLTVTNQSALSTTANTTATITTTGPSFSGTVHSGSTAVSNAHVYLFAANTTGYGQPSVSELSATGFADGTGSYVPTNSTGAFTIPAGYACAATTQLYLYVTGGTIGTVTNTANGFLALVGTCGVSTASVAVNEVSTIAAAYAFAGFAVDPTHVSSSGTALALTGVTNAFNSASQIVASSTGAALASNPAGTAVAPQTLLNTLANILAACNLSASSSSTPCSTLFTNAESGGATGTAPADTATAAINIAHHPGVNVTTLFGATALTTPFSPALTAAPNDFTVGLKFTTLAFSGAFALAVDSLGNVFVADNYRFAVSRITTSGAISDVFYANPNYFPSGLAIDTSNNIYVANSGINNIVKFNTSSPTILATYSGGGLFYPESIAIDGKGNIWAGNSYFTATRVSNTGTVSGPYALEPTPDLYNLAALGLAIDGSGSVWTFDYETTVKLLPTGDIAPGSPFLCPYVGSGNGIALDSSGRAWASADGNIAEFSNSGTLLSGTFGYGASAGIIYSYETAIDGAGNIWTTNLGYYDVSEISNTGASISGPKGYQGGGLGPPQDDFLQQFPIAIDGSGNVWVATNDNYTVRELIGAAVPVITPIAAGLPSTYTTDGSSNLGTRP